MTGSEISLGVNSKIRVVTFVGKEWRNSGSDVRSIVVCEFCQGKQVRPIILLVIAVHLEILFESLVNTFGLTVAFRMMSGGEVKSHVESFSQGVEEV